MPIRKTSVVSKKISCPSIVLRTFPFGDNDLILRVLSSDEGKISVFSKNARKSTRRAKFRADIFDNGILTAELGSGEMYKLVEFEPVENMSGLSADLDKCLVASCLLEIADFISHEGDESSPQQFLILENGLNAIKEAKSCKECLRALYLSIQEFLCLAGLLPSNILALSPGSSGLSRMFSIIEDYRTKPLQTVSSLSPLIRP